MNDDHLLALANYEAAQAESYLSDGAYVSFDGFYLWLTTSNGIEVTNKVALDPDAWAALKRYVKQLERTNAALVKAKEADDSL